MEQGLRGLLPEEMLTDHLDMDLEHEEIFARIEALRREDQEVDSDFIRQLSDLLAFLAEHFVMEERLAAEARLEFSAHTQSHAQNLHLLKKAVEEIKRGGMDVSSFLRYADYWFEHHINEFDKPFARRLQAHSSARIHAGLGASRLSA